MRTETNIRDLLARSSMLSLLDEARKSIFWMFDGLIENDRVNGHQWLITGAPKAGKSRLAMQLAIAAAEGTDFLGFAANRKNKILYFNFELTPRIMGQRALQFFAGDEDRMAQCNGRLIVINEWSVVDVLDAGWADYLKKIILEVEPDLIVWDVMKRMTSAEENNNVEMSKVMRSIRDISSRRTHVVVHHSRKEMYERNAGAGGIRGASAIHAEVDGVISIAKVGNRNTLKFSVRSIPGLEEIRLVNNGIGFSLVTDESVNERRELNIDDLFSNAEAVSRTEVLDYLKEHFGRSESSADRHLKSLIKAEVLTKSGRGREVMYQKVDNRS